MAITLGQLKGISVNPSYTPLPSNAIPATDKFIPDLGGVYYSIYFSEFGDDTNGNGNSDDPFATLERAVQAIIEVCNGSWQNGGFILVCVGETTISNDYVLPPLYSPDALGSQSSVLGYRAISPLRIQGGGPTLVQTIANANIIAEGTSPQNLKRIQTNLVLVPNALNNKVLVTNNGISGVIQSNDASDIFVAMQSGSLSKPYRIYDIVDSITPESANFSPTITIANGNVIPVFQGVHIVDATNDVAIELDGSSAVFEACIVDGIQTNLSGTPTHQSSIIANGTLINDFVSLLNGCLEGTGLKMDTCDLSIADRLSSMNLFAFIADECSALGSGTAPFIESYAILKLIRGAIISGTGNGVEVFGDCFVSLSQIDIENSANNGVYCHDGVKAQLDNVTAVVANANYGLNIDTGSIVSVDDDTDIDGATADILIGPFEIAWLDFREGASAPYQFYDGNSLLYQGSLSGLYLQARKPSMNVANQTIAVDPNLHYQFNCDSSAGDCIFDLPPIEEARGMEFWFYLHVDGNDIIVNADGTDTINDDPDQTQSTQYVNFGVRAPLTGINWIML